MGKFKHEDAMERSMPAPPIRKYEEVDFNDCEVRWQRFAGLSHYRRTLGDALVALEDDRVFGLGLEPEDLDCAHEVVADRLGNARCSLCQGHLWCASWVAEDVFGDDTTHWANNVAWFYSDRLPKPALIR